MNCLDVAPEILALAEELGAGSGAPVDGILAFCHRRIDAWVDVAGGVDNTNALDSLVTNRLAGLLSRESRRLGQNQLGNQHWRPISDFLRNADVIENELIEGIVQSNVPARPGRAKCQGCDLLAICPHARGKVKV